MVNKDFHTLVHGRSDCAVSVGRRDLAVRMIVSLRHRLIAIILSIIVIVINKG